MEEEIEEYYDRERGRRVGRREEEQRVKTWGGGRVLVVINKTIHRGDIPE